MAFQLQPTALNYNFITLQIFMNTFSNKLIRFTSTNALTYSMMNDAINVWLVWLNCQMHLYDFNQKLDELLLLKLTLFFLMKHWINRVFLERLLKIVDFSTKGLTHQPILSFSGKQIKRHVVFCCLDIRFSWQRRAFQGNFKSNNPFVLFIAFYWLRRYFVIFSLETTLILIYLSHEKKWPKKSSI